MAKRKLASFDVTPEDRDTIRKIVERAIREDASIDKLTATMDITACHASGNPIRLGELLAADDFNFAHDVYGIFGCIDRQSGALKKHFSPRYSVQR